jgi:hypothetical protein
MRVYIFFVFHIHSYTQIEFSVRNHAEAHLIMHMFLQELLRKTSGACFRRPIGLLPRLYSLMK